MSKEIVIRYSGVFNRSNIQVIGDVEACIVSMIDQETNTEKVIFTGDKFDLKKYKERGGLEDEEGIVPDFLKQEE